jgi:hypothetical protein
MQSLWCETLARYTCEHALKPQNRMACLLLVLVCLLIQKKLGVPPNRHMPIGVGCSAISQAVALSGILLKSHHTCTTALAPASPPHACVRTTRTHAGDRGLVTEAREILNAYGALSERTYEFATSCRDMKSRTSK